MDLMTIIWNDMQKQLPMDQTIDIDSAVVDEIDKCLSSSEYHMGDFVTPFRTIRDHLYSYERSHNRSIDGSITHLIHKPELEELLLIYCGIIKSMKKRETYLEVKVDDLQKKIDDDELIKDDWVMVSTEEIPDNVRIEENKRRGWMRWN